MSRLEDLKLLAEVINAEIEELERVQLEEDILDETLEEMTEDLLDELEDDDRCPCCVVKRFLEISYNMGYEDAVNDLMD